MSRTLIAAVAQMGPVARDESRVQVIDRLIALMREAHGRGAKLVVFPELALTTFFPRWLLDTQEEIDSYFETEVPSNETQPLFEVGKDLGVGFHLGYAEKMTGDDGATHYFNTAILVDEKGGIRAAQRLSL